MTRINHLLGEDLFNGADLAAQGEIRNVEREVISKSGTRRVVLVHVKKVSINGSTHLFTCRDVTELKQTEEELRVARLDLAHAGAR
jgi:PAS domain S-box-containing protein